MYMQIYSVLQHITCNDILGHGIGAAEIPSPLGGVSVLHTYIH